MWLKVLLTEYTKWKECTNIEKLFNGVKSQNTSKNKTTGCWIWSFFDDADTTAGL